MKLFKPQVAKFDKWSIHNLEQAVNKLLLIKTTNFDSLIKNIQNHEDIPFGSSGPAMEKGLMISGYFKMEKFSQK